MLTITPDGRRVLRGEVTPRLLKPAVRAKTQAAAAPASWEGVDRGLFEALREYRRRKAQPSAACRRSWSSATRRSATWPAAGLPRANDCSTCMASARRSAPSMASELLEEIGRYCGTHQVERDVTPAAAIPSSRRSAGASGPSGSAAKRHAFEMFKQGQSLDAVQQTIGRARSTTIDYLCEHIELEGICDASFWLDEGVCQRVQQAATQVGGDRLRPIFDALNGTVAYDEIRIALACLKQSGRS